VEHIGPDQENEGPEIRWLRLMNECVVAILRPLSEQEAIMLDWLRQRGAHVSQRSYGLRYVKEKDKNREHRGIEILGGKLFTIDETDAARAAVLREHAGDEVEMQVALARKMLPAIRTFEMAHDVSTTPR
jgi:hypothetical protein